MPSPLESAAAPFDAEKLRADFPVLEQSVNGSPLVYLDSAATTQKPPPGRDPAVAEAGEVAAVTLRPRASR